MKHDPRTVAVGVVGSFVGAVQAAGAASQFASAGGMNPVIVKDLLELRDVCSSLRGTFDTYVASAFSLPFDLGPPLGPMVVVPPLARPSYRKLVVALATKMRDLNSAVVSLGSHTEETWEVVPLPVSAVELADQGWFLVGQVHEYNIDNFLNRAKDLMQSCCDFVSEVAKESLAMWPERSEG